MRRKKYRGEINIPAILKALGEAERFLQSDDAEDKKLGTSLKRFFQKLFERRQKELREAIEKSAKLQQKKIWREECKKE
ncbi:MAG: hypothetical protein NT098_04475 [Candidatus Parcubacteria bacterium]|nr:hypothetical protein [Candidatus Parcubacteria bacterium]